MDQTALVKKALGRIKKLAQTSTAERFKKKAAAKSAPPAKVEPVEALEEVDDELPEIDEVDDEDDEPEDVSKKTTLVTITRGRPRLPPKDSFPTQTKRKPGRPKKA